MAENLKDYRGWCRAKLVPLSMRHRVAFAASCSERQFGTYVCISRDDSRLKPALIRRAIDRGWAVASGQIVITAELETVRQQIEPLIPNLDEDPPKHGSLVLDAAAAAAYLLNVCLTGSVDDAVWAGECARNAVDEWVVSSLTAINGSLTPVTIKPGEYQQLQARVESHPMMLREMQQQHDDIAYLYGHSQLGEKECAELRRSWPNGPRSNIDLE